MTLPTQRHVMAAGLRLAYWDFGGTGTPLVALHGHFGRARMFARLAADLGEGFRVIALDLRGHGNSDRADDFEPDAYLADVAAFLRHLDLGPVAVLGHSMGGVLAFRLAARHPELVSTLVVEEGGALNRQPVVAHPVLDVRGWPRRTATLGDLRRAIEAHGIPDAGYFLESAVEHPDGWGLLFDREDMMASQQALIGDWWSDWLGSHCPALLVHGLDSAILPTSLASEMVRRRPDTVLREFSGCGHWVHDDAPAEFASVVGDFLRQPATTTG
ncbi:alpha/beta fold hydrolase [Actinoalloteichus hymeniacidonis]|uniref:Hydrolase or acyltransferase of alpha/beta superfamily n=1 Tax=Actinoalloteichus hymeniacidonis TaxID=340345 RepID=A0AAC9HQV0_9PSEU|nr:alpha/beta hydrolase [Actinoalloteichus hymeniacidonis]AOS63653.1 putative hydrolase or acyltransferase of alpha/beta superfamily [Actinoalloteichus hymeniacidonis]MBB5908299.1 pimeloyl-ACP methyl ester carboxylesterase [Actinoalloteichus hymeniacidonis]